eukprot:5315204-Amphidinium_carterae.1
MPKQKCLTAVILWVLMVTSTLVGMAIKPAPLAVLSGLFSVYRAKRTLFVRVAISSNATNCSIGGTSS